MRAPEIFLTHSGTGHADDLLAFSMARILWPEIRLIRSRDFRFTDGELQIGSGLSAESYRDGSYIVADVGGTYDPARRIYDHHQPGSPTRSDGHPYSAAGLFFKHHGRQILHLLQPDAPDDVIEQSFRDLDEYLLLPIDLADNTGCSFYEPDTEIRGFSFSDYVAMSRCGLMTDFEELAMSVGVVIRKGMEQYLDANIRGRDLRRLGERCGEGVLAVDAFYPSARRFLETTPVRILVHPNPEGRWNARWVKDGLFPSAWRGRIDGELEDISGIQGAVFCHRSGHLAVARTREDAVMLAELALRSS